MSRPILSSLLWCVNILMFWAGLVGVYANAATAGNAWGPAVRPLVNSYTGLWPCLVLVYFSYLGLAGQTPDQESLSANFAITVMPIRTKQLRLILGFLFVMSFTASVGLILTDLVSDWPAFVFGLLSPVLLLAFFFWHLMAYTANYQANRGPSKVSLLLHHLLYLMLAVLFGFHAAGWALYGRYDVVVWDALVVAACAVNLYIVGDVAFGHRIKDDGGKLYREVDLRNPFQQKVIVEQAFKKKLSLASKMALGLNDVLKATFVLLTALLINGAVLHGTGSQLFYLAAMGESSSFLTIQPSDGVDQRIHYRCQGESGSTLPTVMLEPGPAVGVADMAALFDAFGETLGQHRVCAMDKPGVGRSDPMRAGQYMAGHAAGYGHLVHALHEAESGFGPPYIFVGIGGGSDIIYEFASFNSSSDLVHSLVLVSPATTWDRDAGFLAGKEGASTREEAAKLQKEEDERRMRRLAEFDALVVPFGLVPYFEQDKTVFDEEHWSSWKLEAKLWYEQTEKFWTSRYWEERRIAKGRDYSKVPYFDSSDLTTESHDLEEDVFDLSLPARVQVNVVAPGRYLSASLYQDYDDCRRPCQDLNRDYDECLERCLDLEAEGADDCADGCPDGDPDYGNCMDRCRPLYDTYADYGDGYDDEGDGDDRFESSEEDAARGRWMKSLAARGGGRVYGCNGEGCSRDGYFAYEDPGLTVDAVMDIYGVY